MRGIIYDTETSSLETPEVVEWARVDIDPANGWKTGIESSGRCCPTRGIECGALAHHHILLSELTGEPSSAEYRLPDGVTHIIGWNIDYDWLASGSPEAVKRIDLEKIARRLWKGLDCYSQASVFYHVFGQLPESRERLLAPRGKRALQDVQNLTGLLYALKTEKPEHFATLETLWDFSQECRIPEEMMFGKHKGQHIREVPTGYRNWYAGQADADPWILKAFEKYPRH